MRTPVFLLVLLVFAVGACSHLPPDGQPVPPDGVRRVLFVGNSLIYVGNAPAVYAALAAVNGSPVQVDMIARGGATLSQRVRDGSVALALAGGGYSTLVLQERGGDLMCSFGPDSCVQSRAALQELADLARSLGVAVMLLGSYQPHPASSRRIVEKEAEAAAAAGMPYLEVSERLRRLRQAEPELGWFAEDGAHPGPDLALLNALLVYQAVHDQVPTVAPLTVTAPIYGTTSGLDGTLRRADDPPPLAGTPGHIHYPASTVAALLNVAASGAAR